MTGAPRPLVPAALSAEGWDIVFQQIVRFADYQVTRLRWRRQFGDLLPGGFDSNSIAAQAITEFLQRCPDSSGFPRRCERLSLSSGEREGVRASLSAADLAHGLKPILWEVKRLVLRQVTRLHHLKENWLLSNEPDLALVLDQDGDLVSPLELLPAPDVQPDEALIRPARRSHTPTGSSGPEHYSLTSPGLAPRKVK
jgi:hypothetical protein